MAVNSSRHFCPTTVDYKFHGSSSFRFLRYSSSISLRSHNDAASGSTTPSRSLGLWRRENRKQNHTKEGRFSDLGVTNDSGISTMERIVERLKNYGFVDEEKETERDVEEGNLPDRRDGSSEESSPFSVYECSEEVKFPWEKVSFKEKKEVGNEVWTAKKESRYTRAEMTLPEAELHRLRNVMFRTKSRIRVKGAGVTPAVVDAIQDKWKGSEIVRLKIEGSNALNMRRMHEILEARTGGLVIWRSGTSVALYRYKGVSNGDAPLNKQIYRRAETAPSSLPTTTSRVDDTFQLVHLPQLEKEITTVENIDRVSSKPEVDYEDEINELLEGLGPRYTDWQGGSPLPVDADMLPGFVPGYEPPFRVLPYGVRSTLGQKEATALRRLAKVLPPHFALGRSRQLQGLAKAMVTLWQKSLIAKVALKRGTQLTTSERMAEDIKTLTGGMLLSRNKDFLVFYRGKSFLSHEVAEALLEKERLARTFQDEEEQARLRASSALVSPSTKSGQNLLSAGTLGETLDASGKWGRNLDDEDHVEEVKQEAEQLRSANLIRKLERKLAFAEKRLLKAERALAKVEETLKPAEQRADLEGITEEERFMFQKLGLRMKAFLLLGRRGVFDGTVENMHLHWKYRELVKILVKAKTFEGARKVALALEAESGGILVSVDKISKGYAVIVYRGKDYKRPSMMRPKNLLTKRKALARSLELQRREALIKHIEAVQARSEQLRAEIEQVELVKDKGDEVLYDNLDMAYSSSDEETDETDGEGDELYMDTYEDEEEDSQDGKIQVTGSLSETDDEHWDSDESDSEFGDASAFSAAPEATSVVDPKNKELHPQP